MYIPPLSCPNSHASSLLSHHCSLCSNFTGLAHFGRIRNLSRLQRFKFNFRRQAWVSFGVGKGVGKIPKGLKGFDGFPALGPRQMKENEGWVANGCRKISNIPKPAGQE